MPTPRLRKSLVGDLEFLPLERNDLLAGVLSVVRIGEAADDVRATGDGEEKLGGSGQLPVIRRISDADFGDLMHSPSCFRSDVNSLTSFFRIIS